ncbi:RNA-binding KH domain-containing protein PEPPER-like isoform X1 [Lolium rigidum]|uniref:RNA-binding KH domain-containing protein PEPPER-like isoform X1 n=1 Tax=Lolium rigidum TaxID=89674 RepID=UPI001F5D0B75|nr:RNA-binding KH domain-containing protein PEPPER-like isoform X1 [Lolium rigidum]
MATATPPPEELAHDAGAEEEEEEDPEEVEPWLNSSDEEPEVPALETWNPAPDSEQQLPPSPPPAPTNSASEAVDEGEVEAAPRWPGFPGASVFRLVVAGDKVGGLIGRGGEIIRRLCEETRARVRILDSTDGGASRIVLISATEETQAEIAPAMHAAIKIFKHVNEIEGINPGVILSAAAPEVCSARLLVPTAQAVHLIGKQGITIKSIREATGATIRIIDEGDLLSNQMVDEKIVEIRGASLKVLNALKSVLGLLRKFLVDHGVLHLFERKNRAADQVQDSSKENPVTYNYALPVNQDLLRSECPSPLNPDDSRYMSHGRDPSVCDLYSPDIRRPTDSLIPKIKQTMQIPLPLAEEIIGVQGQTITDIRSISGAVVVLEETGDYLDEVLVTVEGSSSQVQTAHRLIQEILSGGREPPPPRSSYRDPDAGPRPLLARYRASATRDYAPSLYHEYQSISDRREHSDYYHGYGL